MTPVPIGASVILFYPIASLEVQRDACVEIPTKCVICTRIGIAITATSTVGLSKRSATRVENRRFLIEQVVRTKDPTEAIPELASERQIEIALRLNLAVKVIEVTIQS